MRKYSIIGEIDTTIRVDNSYCCHIVLLLLCMETYGKYKKYWSYKVLINKMKNYEGNVILKQRYLISNELPLLFLLKCVNIYLFT